MSEHITPKIPALIYGADYNPDQWLHMPEVLDRDIELMKKAGCNLMSVGIFAWAALEPEEGRFTFEWLDRVMDRLYQNGIFVNLATPSGARPAWLDAKYPEVLRVNADRTRNLHGFRHNHNYSSPVFREKVTEINTRLAERYKDHPALVMWHVSNEYGGEDHSPQSQEAFRAWLRERYDDDLDALNRAWWTAFWSKTYSDWSQIESPAPHGESVVHGLNLDWKRFVTEQTIDFFRVEKEPLRRITPDIPITTNFMGTYPGLNYFRFRDEVDVVSWDSYPCWHGVGTDSGPTENAAWDPQGRDWKLASDVGFLHDLNRSIKGRPFMLMESTPSMTNWQPVCKLQRPGMNILSKLQAVAHGSDTVQYFQWRKSLGSFEKFHGAVVDHSDRDDTRVFREAADLGSRLESLAQVAGSDTHASVAILFDWENRWALEDAMGPRNDGRRNYVERCKQHYLPFWQRGIAVDVIDSEDPLEAYQLVVAPMLYMLKPGAERNIRRFVEAGGTFVTTYWSCIVDQHDLCFFGGFPGPLRDVLGIWNEEIDSLYPEERNALVPDADCDLTLRAEYELRELCERIHAETAQPLAHYKTDFYAGEPALTRNRYGGGQAYYLAARAGEDFLDDFYGELAYRLGLPRAVDAELPRGVTVRERRSGDNTYLFFQNFTTDTHRIELNEQYRDLVTGAAVRNELRLDAYGVRVLTPAAH